MEKKYICEHCHTGCLNFDAEAVWNIEKQKFIFNMSEGYLQSRKAFCTVCDDWVSYTEFEAEEHETKHSSIDIDLNEMDKNQLMDMIMYAHKNNITFNEAIIQCLELFIKNNNL